jgi:Na+-driven multidrug efflux pump
VILLFSTKICLFYEKREIFLRGNKMKDLTKGKPSRLILAFALPIFLANLLQLTYSLVDTRIVGSFLGEDALAAVGATSSLSNLIIGFLMGLSNGFAIITAQRFGAKDLRGVKKSFAMSLTLGIAVAVYSGAADRQTSGRHLCRI